MAEIYGNTTTTPINPDAFADGGSGIIDLTYNPESENAQSGIAVADAIKGLKGEQGPQGVSGVYVGSGDMPEGYNVQIDLSGETVDMNALATKDYVEEEITRLDISAYATKEYVEEEIATFDFIKVVDTLPETGLPNRIYLIPRTDTGENNLFDEYLWVDNAWEFITTKVVEVDLTNYATKDYVDNDISIVNDDISDLQNSVEENIHSIETLSNEQTSLSKRISDNETSINNMSCDYIVEQGTSGIWTWEKWNSGKAVCWGNQSLTVTINEAWGNIVGSPSFNVAFPFEFMAIPIVTAQILYTSNNCFLAATPGNASNSVSGNYTLCRATPYEGVQCTVSWYVIGNWK